MKTRMKEFAELGLLMDESKPKINYSFQRTSNQFDLSRYIHGQPYWQEIVPYREPKKKKLILNYWECLFTLYSLDGYLLHFLYNQGFKIYIRTGQHEIHEMTLSMLKEKIYEVALCENEVIKAELTNPNEYLIIDQVIRKRLFDKFISYLCTDILDPIFKINETELEIQENLVLAPATLQNLTDYATPERIKKIRYRLKKGDANRETSIVWDNTQFKSGELYDLLLNLQSHPEIQEIILHSQYTKKIKHCDFKLTGSYTEFNIAPLYAVKSLKIRSTHLNKIVGLSYLNELQVLKLMKISSLKTLSLKGLKDLRKLIINGCDGLENIVDLEDVSNIDELCLASNDKLSLDFIEKFTNLRKLTITCKKNIDINSLLASCPTLEKLVLIDNSYTNRSINISSLAILNELCIYGKQESTTLIGLGHVLQLKDLKLGNISVDTLDFSKLPHLHTVFLDRVVSDSVTFNNSYIVNLHLKNSVVFKVDLSALESLENFSISGCTWRQTFNIDKCKQLKKLNINVLHLMEKVNLDLSVFPELQSLCLNDVNILINNIEKCHQLEYLKIKNINPSSIINLGGLNKLSKITIYFEPIDSMNGFKELINNQQIIYLDLSGKLTEKYAAELKGYIFYGRQGYNVSEQYKPIYVFDNRSTYIKRINHLPLTIANKPETTVASVQATAINYRTHTSPETKVQVERFFQPITSQKSVPSSREYRIHVNDIVILIDDNEVAWTNNSDHSDWQPIELNSNPSNVAEYQGVTTINLQGTDLCTLPSLTANDELISHSNLDQLQAYYNPITNQYAVGIKQGIFPSVALSAFSFTLHKATTYFVPYFAHQLSTQVAVPALPEALNLSLQNAMQDKNKPHLFKLNEQIQITKNDKNEIIKILFHYANQFKNEKLSEKWASLSGIDAFIQLMEEKKGACSHRAMVLIVLLHYYKIPARGIENMQHVYIEVPVELKNMKGIYWIAPEIGGADITLVETDHPAFNLIKKINEYKNNIIKQKKNIPPEVNKNKSVSVIAPILNESSINQYRSLFKPDTRWEKACLQLETMLEEIANHKRPIIIRNKPKEAWKWHHIFSQFTTDKKINFVYIDNASELSSLFNFIKIDHSKINNVPGILQQLIIQGMGMILVNWSNFTFAERATFKSMMDDTSPSLHDKQLSKAIRIIGLLEEQIDAHEVFMSRCVAVKPAFNLKQLNIANYPKQPWQSSFTNETSVNLFGSCQWYKYLVENITANNNAFTAMPMPLVQAIQTGLPITILNAPFDDPTFKRFWHQICTENRLVYNGELLDLTEKPGFSIFLDSTEMNMPESDYIIFDNALQTSNICYIHPSNFDFLFEIQYIDNNDVIHTKPGWLKTCNLKTTQFVIQDTVSDAEWQRLYHCLDQSKISLHVYIDTTLNKIENTMQLKDLDHLVNIQSDVPHLHIESQDIHFIKEFLAQQFYIKNTNIFYLSNESTWSTLIEDIQPYKKDGGFYASRCTMQFWEKLSAGETVVVCGSISLSEYMAFHSLFLSTSVLCVNGEQHKIKGQLIWISQVNEDYKPANVFRYDPTFKDYDYLLTSQKNTINKDLADKIEFFYSCVKVAEDFQTSYGQITFAKYRAIQNCVKKNIYYINNPLKPILQYYYRKGTEQYAFLNTMAKVLFGLFGDHEVNNLALYPLVKKLKSKNDFDRFQWRLINCFDKCEILNLFGKQIGYVNGPSKWPVLNDEVKDKLLTRLIYLYPELERQEWIQDKELSRYKPFAYFRKDSRENRYKKQIIRLKLALESPDKYLILLLGETGTGKTYTAKDIIKKLSMKLHYGMNSYYKWIKEGGVLVLDEATLAKTGEWEFLRTHLSKTHKVVMTGNPFYYTGRYFHSIIWEMAEVIWFSAFENDFITKKIHDYILKASKNPATLKEGEKIRMVIQILSAHYTYLTHQEKMNEFTLRDIENICIRMVFLYENTDANWYTCAQQATVDEIISYFKDNNARTNFLTLLEKNGKWNQLSPTCLPTSRNLAIPPSKHHVWRMVENDLDLRQKRINSATNSYGKLGSILTGASGVGKSTLWEVALQQRGITRDAMNSQMRFYLITAGSKGVSETLKKAFHDGSIVILDELNVDAPNEDESIEQLLNQLLSGNDMHGKSAEKAGFMVLASQNPNHYAGCGPNLVAMLNRFHSIEMGEYSNEDLEYIAKKLNHPEPAELREAYQIEKHEQKNINARCFFNVMKQSLPRRAPAQIPTPENQCILI